MSLELLMKRTAGGDRVENASERIRSAGDEAERIAAIRIASRRRGRELKDPLMLNLRAIRQTMQVLASLISVGRLKARSGDFVFSDGRENPDILTMLDNIEQTLPAIFKIFDLVRAAYNGHFSASWFRVQKMFNGSSDFAELRADLNRTSAIKILLDEMRSLGAELKSAAELAGANLTVTDDGEEGEIGMPQELLNNLTGQVHRLVEYIERRLDGCEYEINVDILAQELKNALNALEVDLDSLSAEIGLEDYNIVYTRGMQPEDLSALVPFLARVQSLREILMEISILYKLTAANRNVAWERIKLKLQAVTAV